MAINFEKHVLDTAKEIGRIHYRMAMPDSQLSPTEEDKLAKLLHVTLLTLQEYAEAYYIQEMEEEG